MEFLIRYLNASITKNTVVNADKTNPRINVYKKNGTKINGKVYKENNSGKYCSCIANSSTKISRINKEA